jgi:hypothetical protein
MVTRIFNDQISQQFETAFTSFFKEARVVGSLIVRHLYAHIMHNL